MLVGTENIIQKDAVTELISWLCSGDSISGRFPGRQGAPCCCAGRRVICGYRTPSQLRRILPCCYLSRSFTCAGKVVLKFPVFQFYLILASFFLSVGAYPLRLSDRIAGAFFRGSAKAEDFWRGGSFVFVLMFRIPYIPGDDFSRRIRFL
jgi:hypothetical protein